ncbi:MAG TPA: heavy metal-associated domain-containing protein [Phycisphaerales bacterium]|nr:heavy metal-associated domain-containing protein [Phycisphaerales bacterium]
MLEKLVEIAWEFWAVLSEMAPYLLFGFFVAGLLSVLISAQRVERHLGGKGFWPVLKAAAFGVPLPLCSCGVIPVSASLRRHGASKGATASFLISTPQTGVDSILVTYSLLGGVFALFRPIAALISGVIGGLLVSLFDRGREAREIDDSARAQPPATVTGNNRFIEAMKYGFVTLPADIGRALLVGLIVAAAISAAIPENYFADVLPPGIGQILILMLAGIPVYVCATASVPIAFALIGTGVSPGAAFAFLMTGPATNAATIATIWKVMGRRTALLYLLTMAGAALAGGLLLDQFLTARQVHAHVGHGGWMIPPLVNHLSAGALLALLAWALAGPLVRRFRPAAQPAVSNGQTTTVLRIDGMTCTHCANSVRRALQECPGVKTADVDLTGNRATVVGADYDVSGLVQAVERLGYSARAMDETA